MITGLEGEAPPPRPSGNYVYAFTSACWLNNAYDVIHLASSWGEGKISKRDKIFNSNTPTYYWDG